MIQLSGEVKYLGLTLDKGLTWKTKLHKVINKTYKAFWTGRGMFGKTWGLKPKVIYWIYSVVVRPIVTYAAAVWWPRFKTSQAERRKLQRMACLGITKAMRTGPTAAIEVLPALPPLFLQVEAQTKAINYRRCCYDQWEPKSECFGHAYMTQVIKRNPSYRWGLIKSYRDTCMINYSQSDFLIY
jgi:hypothetical protein